MEPKTAALLADPIPGSHIIYPCTEEGRITDAVSFYAARGLAQGEGVILFVTGTHREVITQRLEADAFDVKRMEADGQLVFVDAKTVLAECVDEGMPTSSLFKATIENVIKTARRDAATGRPRKVRVFGEMVSLLCRMSTDAALRLEQLWDDIIKAHSMPVFCAYALDWQGSTPLPPAIMLLHSHTIPA